MIAAIIEKGLFLLGWARTGLLVTMLAALHDGASPLQVIRTDN